MKLLIQQHHALRTALALAIDELEDYPQQDTTMRLLAATLAEVLLKMNRQAIEIKAKYALKLSVPQEYAMVLAKQMGLFDTSTYQRITTGNILTELQQKLG
jgi:hypothetical protein